jgi:hypothetical protein
MSRNASINRANVCSFTFANGHRCRTPRTPAHRHLCYDHARRESQARAAEALGRDISYTFSGHYSSTFGHGASFTRPSPTGWPNVRL